MTNQPFYLLDASEVAVRRSVALFRSRREQLTAKEQVLLRNLWDAMPPGDLSHLITKLPATLAERFAGKKRELAHLDKRQQAIKGKGLLSGILALPELSALDAQKQELQRELGQVELEAMAHMVRADQWPLEIDKGGTPPRDQLNALDEAIAEVDCALREQEQLLVVKQKEVGDLLAKVGDPSLLRVRPEAFQHPDDVTAMADLAKDEQLGRLAASMMADNIEKHLYMQHLADDVRVTQRQCAPLYREFMTVVRFFGVQEPALFIDRSSEVNAHTVGDKRPIVVVTSSLIDAFTEMELRAVMAHEVGHIACRHSLYLTLSNLMLARCGLPAGMGVGIGPLFGLLGLGIGAILDGLSWMSRQQLQQKLFAWYKKSELSADRAALLCVRDPAVLVSTMMKLAGGAKTLSGGMDIGEFLAQADEYELLDFAPQGTEIKETLTTDLDHPFPAVRAKEIARWAETGQFLELQRHLDSAVS